MDQHESALLIGILLLSISLRVLVAFLLGNEVVVPPLLKDQISYHSLAVRLITGHGFSFDRGWYPFTPPDTPTAHWSFLYSLFIAAVYSVFGVHPLAVRLTQAVLAGALLPWMLYRLAKRIFEGASPALPLVTALLAAVYAYFVLYAATLMTESLYLIAVVWSLERTLALRATLVQKGRLRAPRQGLYLGLSLGIATLLRQSFLPWVPVLFVWLLWLGWRMKRLRTVAVTLAIAALVLALCILPFTIRNYRVYGQFLLLNSNAGYAMYSAQHPMHGTHFQEFAAAPIPEDLRGRGLNEAQLDRELMRRGIGFILADPRRYVLLCLSRVGDYFKFWPAPDTTLLHNIGRVGSFGLLLPFMLYGLWLGLRRNGLSRGPKTWVQFATTPPALILIFAIYYSTLHILTWAMIRYRLPVDAVLLPFAALALIHLAQKGLQRWSPSQP